MRSSLKPKFHYTNFVTFTETSLRGKSWTQIMKVRNTNHVGDFHDLCRWQSPWTLWQTFLVHCNGLNSIKATRMGSSRTCHELRRKHLDMSRWFVSATFVICVRDFTKTSWFHDLSPFVSVTFMTFVRDFTALHCLTEQTVTSTAGPWLFQLKWNRVQSPAYTFSLQAQHLIMSCSGSILVKSIPSTLGWLLTMTKQTIGSINL